MTPCKTGCSHDNSRQYERSEKRQMVPRQKKRARYETRIVARLAGQYYFYCVTGGRQHFSEHYPSCRLAGVIYRGDYGAVCGCDISEVSASTGWHRGVSVSRPPRVSCSFSAIHIPCPCSGNVYCSGNRGLHYAVSVLLILSVSVPGKGNCQVRLFLMVNVAAFFCITSN